MLIESGATDDKDLYNNQTPLQIALQGNNEKLKDLMQSHFGKQKLETRFLAVIMNEFLLQLVCNI